MLPIADRSDRLITEFHVDTREFALLKHLATHPGRALTRDPSLDAVWADDIIVTQGSVDRGVTAL